MFFFAIAAYGFELDVNFPQCKKFQHYQGRYVPLLPIETFKNNVKDSGKEILKGTFFVNPEHYGPVLLNFKPLGNRNIEEYTVGKKASKYKFLI